MSFDARVYFDSVPADLAPSLQARVRELGMPDTVRIPADWETSGFWYFDVPPESSGGLEVEAGPLDRSQLDEDDLRPDERALLASARYAVFVTTRLGAGNQALMYAGAIARATNGILVEYQGAAFEEGFARELTPHRGPRGPEGQPTLVERGFYDARLAWEIAKAAAAYEQREAGGTPPPAPAAPDKSKRNFWGLALLGVALLVAGGKLMRDRKRRNEGK